MEQSFEETAAASSPPKKKRGRPKKADKVPTLRPPPPPPPPQPSDAAPVTAKDAPKFRRKKRKGFSKSSAPVSHGRKRKLPQLGISSFLNLPQNGDTAVAAAPAASAGIAAEKPECAPVNVKVGQSVHGVVDGAFDAGYLVTVRVGDSETVFRGVVFGPGLSLPLNRDNDVAPKMKQVTRDDIAASSGSPSEAAPVQTTSVAVSTHGPPVPATIQVTPSGPPSGSEAHRIATMVGGSTGMGYQVPIPAAPPLGAAGSYTSPIYRSPSFAVPGSIQNAPGGFYYAHTQSPSPSANHGQGGYYPPRAFPYPFHFPRAEYGGSPPQFTGSAASSSPSLRGSLPPRTS